VIPNHESAVGSVPITPDPLQGEKDAVRAYPRKNGGRHKQQHKHRMASTEVSLPEPLQPALVPPPGPSRDIPTRLHPAGHGGHLVVVVVPAGGLDRGQP
jgi:hypothetical protein